MAELSVIDTGPGLAPQVSAQLFQPFVTTKKQGMGVGLSICRTIVEVARRSHLGRGNGNGWHRFSVHLTIIEKDEVTNSRQ